MGARHKFPWAVPQHLARRGTEKWVHPGDEPAGAAYLGAGAAPPEPGAAGAAPGPPGAAPGAPGIAPGGGGGGWLAAEVPSSSFTVSPHPLMASMPAIRITDKPTAIQFFIRASPSHRKPRLRGIQTPCEPHRRKPFRFLKRCAGVRCSVPGSFSFCRLQACSEMAAGLGSLCYFVGSVRQEAAGVPCRRLETICKYRRRCLRCCRPLEG